MIISEVKHENLRKIIDELGPDADDDLTFEKLAPELNQSALISSVYIDDDNQIHWMRLYNEQGEFAALFTDMDEFRKTDPEFEIPPSQNDFLFYKLLFQCLDIDGFVLNPNSEGIILDERFFTNPEMPQHNPFSKDDTYTSQELKCIMDSADNTDLEEFIKNPKNAGRYEKLFELISHSTMMMLMLSFQNLTDLAEDGVIAKNENEPLGFHYVERMGGDYATVYTSQSRMRTVRTKFNRYCQVVNFSQVVYFILHFDMDGLIINPGNEHVVISREVLIEFSSLIHETCNDSRLNSGIDHMFPIENEEYM